MKRHVLSLFSLFFLSSGVAQAEIGVSADGRGDAVFVPFYTVEDGQDTLLTVSNGAADPTLVMVRFVEALNGQQVYAFTLTLPPGGTWTAAVTLENQGLTTLNTVSDVCTVPILKGATLPFRQFRTFEYADNFPDGGPTGIERTRVGAIEVIELGTATGALGEDITALDCEATQDRFHIINGASPLPAIAEMLAEPGRRISASAQVVNVAEGTVYSLEGVALKGVIGVPQAVLPGERLPRLTTPVLAEGETEFVVNTRYGRFGFPADRGADAISALFMTGRLEGEVALDASIGASTDLIIGFPTRHDYVSDLPHALTVDGQTVAPFVADFTADGACEAVASERRDEAGREVAAGAPIVEPVAQESTLCGQTNRVSLAADPDGAGLRASLRFEGAERRLAASRLLLGSPARQSVTISGLPAYGVRLTRAINGDVTPGQLANYTFSEVLRSSPPVVVSAP